MTTIDDVARRAQVSTATVSHVLNGTRFVASHTRQRVQTAIQELHFQPSSVARGLATDTTHTVGVMVADITNPFFGNILRGVEDRLAPQGYGLFVCNTDEKPEREALYLDLFLRKRVDGLLIAPTGSPQTQFGDFAHRGTAMVYLDRRPPDAAGTFIGIDNCAAGYLAAEHLLRLGHTRIGFLARHPLLYTVTGRVGGYRQALLDFGVPVDERLISFVAPSQEGATEGAKQLLTGIPRPTALITGNHVMTQGFLQAMQELGLRWPDDLSLVSFDDHPWAGLFSPPLTVIAQPLEEMMDAAVASLLAAMASRSRQADEDPALSSPAVTERLLSARLIVRGSTAPVGV
jgi:LacI family transcriptional regulator